MKGFGAIEKRLEFVEERLQHVSFIPQLSYLGEAILVALEIDSDISSFEVVGCVHQALHCFWENFLKRYFESFCKGALKALFKMY